MYYLKYSFSFLINNSGNIDNANKNSKNKIDCNKTQIGTPSILTATPHGFYV
jgi:hypothetical protein